MLSVSWQGYKFGCCILFLNLGFMLYCYFDEGCIWMYFFISFICGVEIKWR